MIIQTSEIITSDNDLKKKLLRSDVKILYQSHVIKVDDEDELERTTIRDLDGNERYGLFTDVLIILARNRFRYSIFFTILFFRRFSEI